MSNVRQPRIANEIYITGFINIATRESSLIDGKSNKNSGKQFARNLQDKIKNEFSPQVMIEANAEIYRMISKY